MFAKLPLKFTAHEDEYLTVMFTSGKEKRVSRLALRLKKPYDSVQDRLITLGFLDEKVKKSKYKSKDEIDYDLIKDGNPEELLSEIRGSFEVHSTKPKSSEGSNNE